jgi:hypothetical protein
MICASAVAAVVITAVAVARARIDAVAIGPTVIAVAIAVPAIVSACIDRAAIPPIVAATINDRDGVAAITGVAHRRAACEGDGEPDDGRAEEFLH